MAALQLAALLATATRYGYHRDELYFIVAGGHPAWGYPDQPPLVPLLCDAMNTIAGGSLLALRLPSAVAAALTTLLAAMIARESGGTRRAQIIAAACTATSGFTLATGHFVTTTTFDVLSTSLLFWLAIRALARRSERCLLLAGAVTGVGFEAKPQVALVAASLVLSLAILGPRWPLRSLWLGGGLAAAAALAIPYTVWQARHGWPQVAVAHHIGGTAEGGRLGFLPFQLVLVSPVLVPVWVAGLAAPFRRPALRGLRFVPAVYAALGVAYLVGDGKAYYLASLYPALLGVGAVPTADWVSRAMAALRTGLLTAAVAISAALGAYIALPLLPPTELQGSVSMLLNPDLGETVGWPAFVATVADVWESLPESQRRQTAIFTSNYGEAAAVDLLGADHHLPAAYSGHNGFGEWAEPPPTATYALLLGFDVQAAAGPFTGCQQEAVIDDGAGLRNREQGLPVLLCKPSMPWRLLWPRLVHDD